MLFETNTRYCARCRSKVCKKPATKHWSREGLTRRSKICWIVIGVILVSRWRQIEQQRLQFGDRNIPQILDSSFRCWPALFNDITLTPSGQLPFTRRYATKMIHNLQNKDRIFIFKYHLRHKIAIAPTDVVLCYRITALGVVSIHSVLSYWAEIYKIKNRICVSKFDIGIFDAYPAIMNLQKTRSYSYGVEKISWRQIKTAKNSFKFKESSSDAQFDERTQRERTCFLSKTCSYEFLPNRLSYKKSLELDMQIEPSLTLH